MPGVLDTPETIAATASVYEIVYHAITSKPGFEQTDIVYEKGSLDIDGNFVAAIENQAVTLTAAETMAMILRAEEIKGTDPSLSHRAITKQALYEALYTKLGVTGGVA